MPKIPDYVAEHFAKHQPNSIGVRPAVECKDGTRYSVQASDGHYCSPKTKDGPWTSFEVWADYPSGKPAKIQGWVARDTINRWIHRHGGIAK
jgi:hypothetical protein